MYGKLDFMQLSNGLIQEPFLDISAIRPNQPPPHGVTWLISRISPSSKCWDNCLESFNV
jgi:hypothetical protein